MRKWLLLVVLAGLFAAGPFLSPRGLGTSEAYNYSLSVADAVTQFRGGTFPVLVGQTEFAFNGRVHPLRTAPYLAYFAGTLDLLTLRQLGFWSLQNLALALSLVGGALSCFWALRRITPVDAPTAAVLSALYILSPAVLAAAYGMDLYMTVMTFPFVPVIIAANLACFTGRKPATLVLLAAALAACWLAHPPIAFWMTMISLVLQLIAIGVRRPTRQEWPALIGAAALFVLLAGFSFASAMTIHPYQNVTKQNDVSGLLTEVSQAFTASLRPVSPDANRLGDFQMGYTGWALAAGALLLAGWQRHGRALVLLGTAAFLFTLTAPVPGLHRWLWEHAPGPALNLTSQWPMQRLYLPMTVLVIFAFALVWRPPVFTRSVLRDAWRVAVAVALAWSLWQGGRFVSRGFGSQYSAPVSAQLHGRNNINLTQISYAFAFTPGDFVHGFMDPAFSFRLLAPYDARESASNWTTALPPAQENQRGTLVAPALGEENHLDLEPTLTLQPGRHYRLAFGFHGAPVTGILQLRGATLHREYHLPTAGGPRSFGLAPGNNPAITLWTTRNEPEEISIRLVGTDVAALSGRPFADYTLERIEPAALPVELQSLLPLRSRVTAAAPGYLETPRIFMPGYAATVNGRAVRVQPSPERLVMLPVPAGTSQVELRYPGPPIVRWAFWLGCLGWVGVAAWAGHRASPARARAWTGQRLTGFWPGIRATIPAWRRWLGATGALLLIVGAAIGWREWSHYRQAVGPVRIRFVLPRTETNRQQPLLVTGGPSAGNFVYAVYVDAEHIRLGVDVWGVLGYQTDPIKVDYFADHEVVIDAGALYPADHPALKDLAPAELARRRNHLRVELDGKTVIDREVKTFDSPVRSLTIGRNLIGGSSCEPEFVGEILAVERLPLSAPPR